MPGHNRGQPGRPRRDTTLASNAVAVAQQIACATCARPVARGAFQRRLATRSIVATAPRAPRHGGWPVARRLVPVPSPRPVTPYSQAPLWRQMSSALQQLTRLRPAQQTWPRAQHVPLSPLMQHPWLGSQQRVTNSAPQPTRPDGQHVPLLQPCPGGQQTAPHTTWLDGQQTPLLQLWPGGQQVSPQPTWPVGQQVSPPHSRPASQQVSPQQWEPAGQQLPPQHTVSAAQQVSPQHVASAASQHEALSQHT
jgi:hypothetical protein